MAILCLRGGDSQPFFFFTFLGDFGPMEKAIQISQFGLGFS